MIIGGGGGASVIITDKFEKKRLKVPQLPEEIIRKIREYTTAAGNILRNPIDYSDSLGFPDKVKKTLNLINDWDSADFLVKFIRTGQTPTLGGKIVPDFLINSNDTVDPEHSKPVAVVIEPGVLPVEQQGMYETVKSCADHELPVYYSFDGAATAIDIVLNHYEINDRRGL